MNNSSLLQASLNNLPKPPIGAFLPLIVLLALSFFTGCGTENHNTAVLWTNRPEFALYVEQFNAAQDDYAIKLVYRENPALSLLNENQKPDIVVGEHLNSRRAIEFFTPLDPLFDEELIPRENIFPQLLQMGYNKDRHLLFPVSFNLPGIMVVKNSIEGSPMLVSMETLQEKCETFMENSNQESMGFSPRWEPAAMVPTAGALGANFMEEREAYLRWDNQALNESMDHINEWVETLHGGPAKELDFQQRFMYDPPYTLLLNERIFAHFTTARDFASLPGKTREELDIHWLAYNSSIPVQEDILFAGIIADTLALKPAQTFFLWFFQPETQKELIRKTQYKRARFFGIGNGFSSLRTVTETTIPLTYPFLAGKTPHPEYLLLPDPLPVTWHKLKNEVITPWMLQRSSINQTSQTLSEEFHTWIQQNPNR